MLAKSLGIVLGLLMFLGTGEDKFVAAGGKTAPTAVKGRKPSRNSGPFSGEDPARHFENFKPLSAGIARTEAIQLFEGLPHQFAETELLAREKESKKTITLHKFDFYAEPLALSPNDAKALKELILSESSFRAMPQFSGKACGGFHPDYAVEFRSGKEVYRVLLCLGCHEMKTYGPKLELYCDIESEAYKKLLKLLRPYDKNRPQLAAPPAEIPVIFGPGSK